MLVARVSKLPASGRHLAELPLSRAPGPGIWNTSKMKLQPPAPAALGAPANCCTMVKAAPALPPSLAHSCVYVFTAKSWWEIGKNYRL